MILDRIIKKKAFEFASEISDETQTFKTFMIDRVVCRIQKVYEKQSIRIFLFKIFIVNERLAVNEFINQHVIRDLLNALKNEKKNVEKEINV